MKTFFSIILLLLTSLSYAQNFNFESGLSISKLRFTNSDGSKLNIDSDIPGSFFSLGASSQQNIGKILYGINLISFNNKITTIELPVQYKTTYFGGFVGLEKSLTNKIDISISMGIRKIFNGTQQMNNEFFSLKENNEFNGTWYAPEIFLRRKVVESDFFNVSLAYGLTKTFKLNYNSPQKLSYFSHLGTIQFRFKKSKVN